MHDYVRILQEHYHAKEPTSDDEHDHSPFHLRNADQLKKKDIGYPLFVYDKMVKVEGLVPKQEDQQLLTKKEQSWLLVEIPIAPDYPTYAWAAFRPPREVPWQKHAQVRSDGYFAPAGWIPKYPEPSKWYKRKPGSAFSQSQEHPTRKLRLRMLVRLSDALNRAALDHTQEWFFIDLPMFEDSPDTDTVGDLLLFAMELVGNQRLRSGHLTLSAGGPNKRLWQRKMPLSLLWNHLHNVEVTAYASLNNSDHLSTFGKLSEEEGEYFAMAAVHSLPDWVLADESKSCETDMLMALAGCPMKRCLKRCLLRSERHRPAARSSSRNKQSVPPRTSTAAAKTNKSTSSTSAAVAKAKKAASSSGKRGKQGAFSFQ